LEYWSIELVELHNEIGRRLKYLGAGDTKSGASRFPTLIPLTLHRSIAAVLRWRFRFLLREGSCGDGRRGDGRGEAGVKGDVCNEGGKFVARHAVLAASRKWAGNCSGR
jgi:hypothetical protein